MMLPDFVDHLVFRVGDLERTERFYSVLLGEPAERTEEGLFYRVGATRVFFTCADGTQTGPYAKEEIGLNHLAFGVRTLEQLRAMQAQLDRCKLAHSDICVDRYGLREFLWLDDPDGMRVEFYLRPYE